jgi:hypothetical protein
MRRVGCLCSPTVIASALLPSSMPPAYRRRCTTTELTGRLSPTWQFTISPVVNPSTARLHECRSLLVSASATPYKSAYYHSRSATARYAAVRSRHDRTAEDILVAVKQSYAIVTPYYKEDRALLERCMNSVRSQTVSADHLLVADGFPQAWIDGKQARHFKLDRSHGDFGNTPRGVGALIAVAEEYNGIGVLDADNWLEHDHVEVCLAAGRALDIPCDYVIAKRIWRRPDESILPAAEESDHIDTNCFFFLRGSFSVLSRWGTMPKRLSPICDRIFWAMLRQQPFTQARVTRATVNYHCIWESIYRSLGETPPADAKPNTAVDLISSWISSLDGRDREIAERLVGAPLSWGRMSRNAPCPCGSGKRYKHCHGASA